MASYLLDANHIGLAVTRSTQVRQRIEEARKAGERLGTCVPVLCEIEAGIQQVSRPDEYRKNLKRLFRFVKIWIRRRHAYMGRSTTSSAEKGERFHKST